MGQPPSNCVAFQFCFESAEDLLPWVRIVVYFDDFAGLPMGFHKGPEFANGTHESNVQLEG